MIDVAPSKPAKKPGMPAKQHQEPQAALGKTGVRNVPEALAKGGEREPRGRVRFDVLFVDNLGNYVFPGILVRCLGLIGASGGTSFTSICRKSNHDFPDQGRRDVSGSVSLSDQEALRAEPVTLLYSFKSPDSISSDEEVGVADASPASFAWVHRGRCVVCVCFSRVTCIVIYGQGSGQGVL